MIRLSYLSDTEKHLADLPYVVVKRMQQANIGDIIFLQPGDDLTNIPELGKDGLLGVIDNEWVGFEHVYLHQEGEKRIYEMVIVIDSDTSVNLFLEDNPWLDDRLQLVLKTETL